MPRLIRVLVPVIAVAALSAPIAYAQDAPARPPKQVVVTAKCPNNGHGPLTVTVNPWTVVVLQDDPTRWILKTNRPSTNSIKIEAKETSDWLYPDRELSGEGEVTFEKMKGNMKRGTEYYYNITVYCGEDKVVIDPRVRVGP